MHFKVQVLSQIEHIELVILKVIVSHMNQPHTKNIFYMLFFTVFQFKKYFRKLTLLVFNIFFLSYHPLIIIPLW